MSDSPRASVADAAELARTAVKDLLDLIEHGAPGDVVEVLTAVESVGRLADAARVSAAAPLASNATLVERLGFTSATDAVSVFARISRPSARARVIVSAAVSADRSISGAELPPQRPALAEALAAGDVGLEAAAVIVRELDAVAPRTDVDVQAAAERLMVTLASGVDPMTGVTTPPVPLEYLTAELRQVAATIDPDGARPREERAARRRGLRLGSPDSDGARPVSGLLMADIGALLEGLLEAQRRTPSFVDLDAIGADASGADRAASSDNRTPDQRRHDAFAEILIAASHAEGAPQLNGSAVTVLVTVNADSLGDDGYGGTDGTAGEGLSGDPIGIMAGTDAPVSRAEVLRHMDAGGYRVVTLHKGRIAGISSPQRCFTSVQRLGIAARDGLRCATPGCTTPHYALQVHHVVPFRENGPTHTDNGILLCYWHHRMVDTGPWHYRMARGVPEVRGPGILDWVPLSVPQRLAA